MRLEPGPQSPHQIDGNSKCWGLRTLENPWSVLISGICASLGAIQPLLHSPPSIPVSSCALSHRAREGKTGMLHSENLIGTSIPQKRKKRKKETKQRLIIEHNVQGSEFFYTMGPCPLAEAIGRSGLLAHGEKDTENPTSPPVLPSIRHRF